MALSNKVNEKNVLLVENLKPNLLSVSQICDQGNICIFDSVKCEIIKKDRKTCWDWCEKSKECIHPRK